MFLPSTTRTLEVPMPLPSRTPNSAGCEPPQPIESTTGYGASAVTRFLCRSTVYLTNHRNGRPSTVRLPETHSAPAQILRNGARYHGDAGAFRSAAEMPAHPDVIEFLIRPDPASRPEHFHDALPAQEGGKVRLPGFAATADIIIPCRSRLRSFDLRPSYRRCVSRAACPSRGEATNRSPR